MTYRQYLIKVGRRRRKKKKEEEEDRKVLYKLLLTRAKKHWVDYSIKSNRLTNK
jgi:hypothetical protein